MCSQRSGRACGPKCYVWSFCSCSKDQIHFRKRLKRRTHTEVIEVTFSLVLCCICTKSTIKQQSIKTTGLELAVTPKLIDRSFSTGASTNQIWVIDVFWRSAGYESIREKKIIFVCLNVIKQIKYWLIVVCISHFWDVIKNEEGNKTNEEQSYQRGRKVPSCICEISIVVTKHNYVSFRLEQSAQLHFNEYESFFIIYIWLTTSIHSSIKGASGLSHLTRVASRIPFRILSSEYNTLDILHRYKNVESKWDWGSEYLLLSPVYGLSRSDQNKAGLEYMVRIYMIRLASPPAVRISSS